MHTFVLSYTILVVFRNFDPACLRWKARTGYQLFNSLVDRVFLRQIKDVHAVSSACICFTCTQIELSRLRYDN